MKQIYALITLFVLSISCNRLLAQCTAPTSIGTPGVTHASCPGNGRIIVGAVSPAAVAPEYYQYALYQFTTEIKPWQNADTFINVNAGTYEIRVRKVCSSGFSSIITRNVTVNNTEAAPAITSITVNRNAKCNNGRFTVTATGSAPLQYAIVPTLTEPELTTNYIRPKQSSNIFDSLPAGTYYVRVYNGCNNAATQPVTVPAYTATTTARIQNISPLNCDSFMLSFRISNFINIANTGDTALSKWWINWPTGTTDTFSTSVTQASGSIHSPAPRFPYSKLSATVSPGSFPDNLSGWPFTLTGGYRDICGNVYLDTLIVNKPTTRTLNLISTEGALSNCDSIAYSFRIIYTPSIGTGTTYHYFTNTNGIMFSVDNGATWRQARTANGSNFQSDYFLLPRNTSATLLVAICGDSLSETFTTASLPDLLLSLSENNLYSCLEKTGIGFTSSNVKGTSIGVSMNSAPAGQPLVPYFETPATVSSTRYPVPLQNLLPGTYSIIFYDTIGVDCPRQTTRTITLAHPAALTGSVDRQCNGDLLVTTSNTYRFVTLNLALGSSFKAEVLNSSGVKVLPSGSGTYAGVSSPGNTSVATITASALNTLPDGAYTIRIKKSGGTSYPYLDTCTAVEIPWNKGNNAPNLDQSQFINGCPGGSATIVAAAQGGKPPYTYTLLDQSNNAVAPSSGNNIYNNLTSNATYTLQVIDACGTVVNRTMSVSGNIAMFASSNSTAVCEGDSASLRVNHMPGVTYQWQQNGTDMPGEDSAILLFNVVTFPQDSGAYMVAVSMGSCVVFTSSFNLTPGQCTPLPVSLLAFTANAQDNSTHLAWATASEHNNKGFYIERSINGQNWDIVHFVNSKAKNGNSAVKLNYTYLDVNKTNVPIYYYRLQQVNLDGTSEYSDVRRVAFKSAAQKYLISPNPAQNMATIYTLKGGENISIYNTLGSLVKKEQVLRPGDYRLNIAALAPGLYLVHIQNIEGLSEIVKLIVR